MKQKLQFVISTHSPHFLSELPNKAIKCFRQLDNGRFAVIPSSHPYAAFWRLGVTDGPSVRVIVEDRLAKYVVEEAISILPDAAERALFHVDIQSGGAQGIWKYHIPSLIGSRENVVVLFDGDQKHEGFVDPDTIPVCDNHKLTETIKKITGVEPMLSLDGGADKDREEQRIKKQRQYLAWIKDNVEFLPTSCPDELILSAAFLVPKAKTDSTGYKRELRSYIFEEVQRKMDNAEFEILARHALAKNKGTSKHLPILAQMLQRHLPRKCLNS